MATKKDIRSDKTYIISTDDTDNPKLGAKILTDGRESLFFDYYLGYRMVYSEKLDKDVPRKERKREYLKLYLWQAPRTPIERQQNKETLELAKKIRFEKEQELKEGNLGYRLKSKANEVNFYDFLNDYYEKYDKGDKRMIKASIKRFNDFVRLEHPLFSKIIQPKNITPSLMEEYMEYLQSIGTGEGPISFWKRWKKIIKSAVKDDILKKDPCIGIVCTTDEGALKKDILSMEEIKMLMDTTYPEQNLITRKAFIFTLYTGIRFCDIKDLTFSNVDFSNRLLTFNQNKTKTSSSKSFVTIPLNDGLLSLIGTPQTNKPDELIFPLPSQTMCLKALKKWCNKAGINKNITWHSGRHSFAVNILNNGANIKTVASLLGHSGLKHTERYTRAVDKLKEDAINSLPELKL